MHFIDEVLQPPSYGWKEYLQNLRDLMYGYFISDDTLTANLMAGKLSKAIEYAQTDTARKFYALHCYHYLICFGMYFNPGDFNRSKKNLIRQHAIS